MGEKPMVPISLEHLSQLAAAMMVYEQFRRRKTPPSEERTHTLLVLAVLLPKLLSGVEPHEGDRPLPLTTDEIQVMKSGLATVLDQLQRKPATGKQVKRRTEEIKKLKHMKQMLDQHFRTTQD